MTAVTSSSRSVTVAAVQFEPVVGNRIANLSAIDRLVRRAARDGAEVVVLPELGDRQRVKHLDQSFVRATLNKIAATIEDGIDRMKTSADGVKLIAVGGGAFLVPEKITGVCQVVTVEHAGIANALGAAMAQVSGEVDQVFSGLSREAAMAKAESLARSRAIMAGAQANSLKVLEAEDLPIAYLPGNARRVRVRVVGDIAFTDPQKSV